MPTVINSDIFVDALRGVNQAKEALKLLSNERGVFYSSITIAEIMSSKACEDQKIKEVTTKIFSVFEQVPVDDPIVHKAAYFRRKYSLLLPDAIIAATAFQIKGDLLTSNIKDFIKVREIKIRGPY